MENTFFLIISLGINIYWVNAVYVDNYYSPMEAKIVKNRIIISTGLFVLCMAGLLYQIHLSAKEESTTTASKEQQVDELFKEFNHPGIPGCAVAIVERGKVLLQKGYGAADIGQNIPITTKTVFDIASVSKQFTAACISMLLDEGKLSLDDDIRKYIPEMPVYAKPVLIKNLLYHTSGIRDWDWITLLSGYALDQGFRKNQMFEFIKRQQDLNFLPGEQHMYSNSGYVLLGIIIERITGKEFKEYVKDTIFELLGMKSTFCYDHPDSMKNLLASGYKPDGKGGYQAENPYYEVASSGIHTTVEDMVLWDQNFRQPKIGGKSFLSMMMSEGTLNNGEKIGYGFGLSIADYKGVKTISHGGAIPGFHSHYLRFPAQDFSVIVLSNNETFNDWLLSRKAAEIYLAECMKKDEVKGGIAERKEITLPKSVFQPYCGQYKIEDNFNITFSCDGDKFYAQGSGQPQFEIFPESETGFFAKVADVQFDFIKDKEGKISEALIHQNGQSISMKKLPPLQISESDRKMYLGAYYSHDLDTTYTITWKEGQFFLESPIPAMDFLQPKLPFSIQDKNWFSLSSMQFHFTRDANGNVTGFLLDISKVRNVKFVKKT